MPPLFSSRAKKLNWLAWFAPNEMTEDEKKEYNEMQNGICAHCGHQMVDGMCDAPLSNAD